MITTATGSNQALMVSDEMDGLSCMIKEGTFSPLLLTWVRRSTPGGKNGAAGLVGMGVPVLWRREIWELGGQSGREPGCRVRGSLHRGGLLSVVRFGLIRYD